MPDVVDNLASLEADAAVALARRALQHAARTNPALADVDRLLADVIGAGRSPEAAAFAQLLTGDQGVDVDLLGMPTVGARVVVARTSDPVRAGAISLGLEDERQVLTVVHAGKVHALVRNVPRRAGEDLALRNATRLAGHVSRIQPGANVGISAAVTEARQIVAAARDAADAAGLAEKRGVPWLSVDEVWGQIAVARLGTMLQGCLPTAHPLARLAEYDRRHHSDLALTVGTWLAHRRDTGETARALLLHPNTLRYRLRRAQDVSGLDLIDPNQALVAQLQLCPAAVEINSGRAAPSSPRR